MNNEVQIPEGYMLDGAGNFRPKKSVRDVDLLRDEITRKLFALGEQVAGKAAEFKQLAFDEINAFVELSHERYGVKWGGKKGNVTMTSYDGKYKIELARQEHIEFTEELAAAQQLILECLETWTSETRSEVRTLINDAFRSNKKGEVSTSKIMGLLRHDFKDPKWLRAMDAIRDSIQVAGTSCYIRLYRRTGGRDQYEQVSLDGTAALKDSTAEVSS